MPKPVTRVFPVSLLREWGLPYEDDDIVLHREQTGSNRWSSIWGLVFRAPDDGKTWMVSYQRGLTEYQDQGPWDDAATVKAKLAREEHKTAVVWVPVTEVQLEPDERPVSLDLGIGQALRDGVYYKRRSPDPRIIGWRSGGDRNALAEAISSMPDQEFTLVIDSKWFRVSTDLPQ